MGNKRANSTGNGWREKKRGRRIRSFRRIIGLILVMMLSISSMPFGLMRVVESAGEELEHTHSAECYLELMCEIGEGHIHGEECYVDIYELICGLDDGEEIEGGIYHSHGDECYDESEEVMCGMGEGEEIEAPVYHHHTDDCYETIYELVCEIPEGHYHSIDGSCYEIHNEPMCGFEVEEELLTEAPQRAGGISLASAPSGSSSDLEDFVISPIVIRDSSGNPATSFIYGNSYDFYITFAEAVAPNYYQFYYDDEGIANGYLYYQLPQELLVVQAVTNQPVYSIDYPTVRIGTYNVDTSGFVTVKFDNVQNNGQPAIESVWNDEEYVNVLKNFIDFYTNARFTLKISAEFSKYGDGVKIDFGSDVTITININRPVGPTLAVSKSIIAYDPVTKTATYSISVTARNGAVKNINLRDYMRGGPSNTILNPNGRISDVIVTSGSLTAGAVTYETNNQYFNIPLTGTLAQDATVTVQYKADISPWVNAVADPNNYSFSTTNYVTATGLDAISNEPVGPADANVAWTVSYQATSLSAGKTLLNYDPVNKMARFSVTVSALYGDINSINLYDSLYFNGAYINPSGKISNVAVSSPGSTLSSPAVTYPDGTHFNIALSGTLAKGNTATVTYTVDLSSVVGAGEYNHSFTNYVTVRAQDSGGRDISADTQVTGVVTYNNASFRATKSFVRYNPETKKATFSVNITATGGAISNISLRDNLVINGSAFNVNGKISGVTVTPGSITAGPVTYEANNQYFNIALIGTLANNATATVTYDVDVSSVVNSGALGNYSYSYTNYVSVTARDVISGQNLGPINAQVSGSISYQKSTLRVTKSLAAYDPAAKTATFRVNITANGGNINNINLRDDLTINGSVINPNGLIAGVTVSVLGGGGSLSFLSPVIYELDNQHFNIRLNGTLVNGQTAVVEYTVNVAQWINAVSDPGNYDVSYINKVSVTAKDVISGEDVVPDNAQVSGNFSYRKATLTVSKSFVSYNPSTKVATFSINVRANGGSINNINLVDRLNFNGANIDPTGLINVTSVTGGLSPGTVTYANPNFTIPLSGTLSSGNSATVTYTVNLSSLVPNGTFSYPFTNYVNVDGKDVISGGDANGSTNNNGNMGYTKPTLSVTKRQVGNNAETTATFSITITALGGSVANPVITDQLVINSAVHDPTDRITVNSVTGGGLTYTPGTISYTTTNFTISLNGTLAAGQSVTVTYTVDYSNLSLGPNYNVSYTNTANVTGTDPVSNTPVTGDGSTSGNFSRIAGGLIIKKSHVALFNPATKIIVFEINATAMDDDLHNIVISDRMRENDSMAWLTMNGTVQTISVAVDGATLDPSFYTASYNGGTQRYQWDFGTYVLARGSTITITFSYDASGFISSWGYSNRNSYSHGYTNYAYGNAKNSADIDLSGSALVNDTVVGTMSRTFSGKKGRSPAGSADDAGYAYWYDWFVGDGYTALNDGVITDTLTDCAIAGDQTLVFTLLRDDGTTTSMSLNIKDGNTSFILVIPGENDIDPLTDAEYGVIVKVTLVDELVTIYYDFFELFKATFKPVSNKISTFVGGNTIDYSVSTNVNRPPLPDPRFNKAYKFVRDPETNKSYIEFTINVIISKYYYGKIIYIRDEQYIDTAAGRRYTPRMTKNDFTITATDANGTRPFTDFNIRDVDDSLNVFIFLGSTAMATADSKSPFTIDTTLNITYMVPLDTKLWEDKGTGTFGITDTTLQQALNDNSSINLYNRAILFYPNLGTGSDTSKDYTVNVYSPIRKTASVRSDGCTVDYTVTINPSRLNPAYSAINPPIFFDTFDSSMEYVPNTFSVIRTHTNGNTYVFAMFKASSVTEPKPDLLASMPPEYFTNNGDGTTTMKIDMRDLNQLSELVGGHVSPLSAYPAGANGNPRGDTGAVYPSDPNWWTETTPYYNIFTIRYTLRCTEPINETLKVYNTFSTLGIDSQCEADLYGPKVVEKGMMQNGTTNTAEVTIEINEGGIQYGDGVSYTAKDVMSDNLVPYLGSITIETKIGGDWTPHPVSSVPGELYSYEVVGPHEIHFVLPDEIPVRITYTVLILIDAGVSGTAKNEIWVSGYYDEAHFDYFEITDTSAVGSGSRNTLQLYKYDAADSSVALPGARFALYVAMSPENYPNGAHPYWNTVSVPSDISRTYTVGGTTFYYVGNGGYGITDANGDYIFSNQWLTPFHNATYLLLEVRPPINYSLPSVPYTLFAYTPKTPVSGTPVQHVSDFITRPNAKIPNLYATIFGRKTVVETYAYVRCTDEECTDTHYHRVGGIYELCTDSCEGPYYHNNAPDKLFTFRLTQVADATGTAMSSPYTAVTTTMGGGEFGFPLSNLTPGTTYYYRITEDTSNISTGWTYDANAEEGYIISVYVPNVPPGGDATVTYPDGFSDEIEFTNEYKYDEEEEPKGDIRFPITKNIINYLDEGNEIEFMFSVTMLDDLDDEDNPETYTLVETRTIPVKILANTTSAYDWFTWADLDVGKDYYFLVKETAGPVDSWKYATVEYIVRARIDANTKETIAGTIYRANSAAEWSSEWGDMYQVVFNNAYEVLRDAEVIIAGRKAVESDQSAPNDEFTFTLTQVNEHGDPLDEPDENVILPDPATATRTGEGMFSFGKIKFEEDAEPGTYYFMVEETGDLPNGWQKLTGPQIVTVELPEEGPAEVIYPGDTGENDGELVFTNRYGRAAKVTIDGEKVVKGDAPEETFTFTLTQVDKDGDPLDEPDENVILPNQTTATVTGEGTFSFGDIIFTEEGEYWFRVTEEVPDTVPEGWKYDPNAETGYIVKVKITDIGGELTPEVTYPAETDGKLVFTNEYSLGGPRLPETGGNGTLPLTVIGVLLMIASGCGLACWRKRESSRWRRRKRAV